MSANHGNTPAAWTGVFIVLVGFVVGGLALVVDNVPMFWIGAALGPLGGAVGYVLGRAGKGHTPLHPES